MPNSENLSFDEEEYIDSMVFNLGTTTLTDFPVYELKVLPLHEFKQRVKTTKSRPPPVTVDINTLQPFQKVIPFNLLHKPKDIIQQLPTEKQEKFVSVRLLTYLGRYLIYLGKYLPSFYFLFNGDVAVTSHASLLGYVSSDFASIRYLCRQVSTV